MFVEVFYALCIACTLLYLYTRSSVSIPEDANFRNFQRSYLVVYLLAVGMFFLHFIFYLFLLNHFSPEEFLRR